MIPFVGRTDVAVQRKTPGGHWRTYTADAPLFGKHVGIFYWSPRSKSVVDDQLTFDDLQNVVVTLY